jgi:hypothetical protein
MEGDTGPEADREIQHREVIIADIRVLMREKVHEMQRYVLVWQSFHALGDHPLIPEWNNTICRRLI